MNTLTTSIQKTVFFAQDTSAATGTVVATDADTSTGGNGTGGKGTTKPKV
jgi:hypothetical protein